MLVYATLPWFFLTSRWTIESGFFKFNIMYLDFLATCKTHTFQNLPSFHNNPNSRIVRMAVCLSVCLSEFKWSTCCERFICLYVCFELNHSLMRFFLTSNCNLNLLLLKKEHALSTSLFWIIFVAWIHF